MARKLYPIGLQTFERIRKEDRLYIDKTEYVYRMAHTNSTYFFLSRPRRFGKSLLTTTLESYFLGKKELFKGLAIEKLETEWTEYPVLHFDMSMGKHMEKDQLQRYLLFILVNNERKYGIKGISESVVASMELDATNGLGLSSFLDPNIRLTNLIQTLYEKTGKQVVVL
ncbi:MAG TPA: hypothetical protein DDW28_00265, partial [Prevotella sp.]|nr:hypothetical protein [Candidatus Segatella violae]